MTRAARNCPHTPDGITCDICAAHRKPPRFSLKGYRKLTVTLVCSAMTFTLALASVTVAAPYVALGTFCTAFCGANLFEYRAKGSES